MTSFSRTPPRPRKKLSRWPASAQLPSLPGSADDGKWPTACSSVPVSKPSATMAEMPRRGISIRPRTPDAGESTTTDLSVAPEGSIARSSNAAASRFDSATWKPCDSRTVFDHIASSTSPRTSSVLGSAWKSEREFIGDRTERDGGETTRAGGTPEHRVENAEAAELVASAVEGDAAHHAELGDVACRVATFDEVVEARRRQPETTEEVGTQLGGRLIRAVVVEEVDSQTRTH